MPLAVFSFRGRLLALTRLERVVSSTTAGLPLLFESTHRFWRAV